MGSSFGFSTDGRSQVVVFSDEQDFHEIVAANPNMTAIMGADDHTRENYPGVFIATIGTTRQTDISVARRSATQRQCE